MRPANQILDVIGRDGALQLHLPRAKSPLRYFVQSGTLISLSKARSGIPNRNLTTLDNADTRLTHKEFYAPGLNQEIAIREMGGVGAVNDSIRRLSQVGGAKHEERMREAITELESLMLGKHIGHNSPGSLRITDSANGRVTKTLIYGKIKKSPIDLEIAKAKKAIIDFANPAKKERIGKKTISRKEGRNYGGSKKVKIDG